MISDMRYLKLSSVFSTKGFFFKNDTRKVLSLIDDTEKWPFPNVSQVENLSEKLSG